MRADVLFSPFLWVPNIRNLKSHYERLSETYSTQLAVTNFNNYWKDSSPIILLVSRTKYLLQQKIERRIPRFCVCLVECKGYLLTVFFFYLYFTFFYMFPHSTKYLAAARCRTNPLLFPIMRFFLLKLLQYKFSLSLLRFKATSCRNLTAPTPLPCHLPLTWTLLIWRSIF